jgi:hypothetical protein
MSVTAVAAAGFLAVPFCADTQSRGRNLKSFMRACLETQKLEQLEARMDEIDGRVARDRTNAPRGGPAIHEAQRPSH